MRGSDDPSASKRGGVTGIVDGGELVGLALATLATGAGMERWPSNEASPNWDDIVGGRRDAALRGAALWRRWAQSAALRWLVPFGKPLPLTRSWKTAAHPLTYTNMHIRAHE